MSRKSHLLIFLSALLLGGAVGHLFGSFARVESMGKNATFFMDDVSIFDNPANINIFPNFLIGEMGGYTRGDADRRAVEAASYGDSNASNVRYNRDPEDPWFGGIFAYSFGDKQEGALYPQFSIAGAFNRRDAELLDLLPDSIILDGTHVVVPEPVTNFDGFMGYTLTNGGMFGIHIYAAVQDGANLVNGELVGTPSPNINTTVFKSNLGINWPVARNMDAEFSFGGALMKFGPSDIDPEISFFTKSRAFITFELIRGELVPIFNYSQFRIPERTITASNAGIGVNSSLDRGFFWLGFEGVWHESNSTGYNETFSHYSYPNDGNDVHELIRGFKVSFGIERNIWWDWLVLRVGGQKLISYNELNDDFYIATNPISTGTPDDHVGFGIGVNVEEKLKVDATVAEDVLYRGGNLLSGPQHHVISRISATYSF